MTKVLALIPARGGSKGVPKKSIAPLGGKPLIAWTIEAALRANSITRTVVTTDDAEVAEAAKRFGAEVPFLRPRELALDDTPGVIPVFHALRWLDERESYRPDVVVNLQPTSPLRTAADIDAAAALLASHNADAVVSVTRASQHPHWMKTVDGDGWMHDFMQGSEPVVTRQELPPVYALNGAIYVARRDALMAAVGWHMPRTAAYIMPFERSIDIDNPWDLAFAELVIQAVHA